MKKFIANMKEKFNRKTAAVEAAAQSLLVNKRGEGYIDTAVKWIIGIVVGGLILTTLYVLFKDNLLTELQTKLEGLFSYTA